ncbi:MAG: DNA recombination protein RmuC [Alphaproteobacteria bacterium]|nr:DNA recombination protein RmuC [Alphaproteobacteria bacterium]
MDPLTALTLGGAVLSALAVILLAVVLRRAAGGDNALGAFDERLARVETIADRLERTMRDETRTMRDEAENRGRALREEIGGTVRSFAELQQTAARDLRTEVTKTLNQVGDDIRATDAQMSEAMRERLTAMATQLAALVEASAAQQRELRLAVEGRLDKLREENAQKLEEMRATVDEKLHATLEKRLGESFMQVSDRLDQVHKGLGEMQTLAAGVGDLKRVLSNVKMRGNWGEVQLGALLEQMLHPDHYIKNARVRRDSGEMVEYAVRLPGQSADGAPVLLPIDAKFPVEDYERLTAAFEASDVVAIESAGRALEARIRQEARRIADKYIEPPGTTDFAIMFLPTEGLYAEVIRRPGLVSELQAQGRVVVTGPTTLGALLNSLQIGFRTLAIQQRSGDIARVLEKTKAEFGKFTLVIEKVQKQIDLASRTLDDEVSRRSRAIERTLREIQVEALPAPDEPAPP